ncbi:peptide chain release factor N(5)-glutamine methyltransferase [Pseudoteredinibacter isoporae]|uniref:Release factor glutamine methyltransferase n=1 Tax=Pseudoteredinibacter isoporae TaxID=570281 RepID=A0A7X0MWC9_9GAMM|nr:release factor glutamine methyltransferase [Pseudoteredinibacter isoporae]
MISIANLLQSAREALRETQSDTIQLDAELLLCHSLQCERSYLFTWPEKQLSEEVVSDFQSLLGRRLNGEPIAHIIGRRDFWDLQLAVNNSTLIPRPDTETLVEEALSRFPKGVENVLDLGTGTGAIALALASEWSDSKVLGVDKSPEAVALAEHNRNANRITNAEFIQSSWFDEIGEARRFQLIVSNPPYIDEHDPHLQRGDVRFEPQSALVADDNGMADLESIIQGAPQYLHANGYLMLEHGYQQAAEVRRVLIARGFESVGSREDLAGHERISFGRWP